VLYIENALGSEHALVCDCKRFHQLGMWCKHCYCLVKLSKLDFTAPLAIHPAFEQESAAGRSFEPVTIENAKPEYLKVTADRSWAKKHCPEVANNQFAALCASRAKLAVKSAKVETRTAQVKDMMHSLTQEALSDPSVAAQLEEFHAALMEQKSTAGDVMGRNPPALDRRKLDNKNKSYAYGAG
jgi:hypothetical protein